MLGMLSMLYNIEFACLQGDGDTAQSNGLDAEENMGNNLPLYQIIDVLASSPSQNGRLTC